LVCSASMLLEQPRLLGFALLFESTNLIRVLQRKADVVETVQHAMLAKRIDIEAEYAAAVRRRNRLQLEIDGELESRKSRRLVKQAVDFGFFQHDGQQSVLETVVEENVGKRRRDDRSEPVIA